MNQRVTINSKAYFSRLAKKLLAVPGFIAILLMSLTTQAAVDPGLESTVNTESAVNNGTVPVGEVSLVLGKAYLVKPDNSRQQVEVGSQVSVNDNILTQANGHVHVRFIDDALVSIRPDSQLEIVRYDYDAEQPDQSSIKFNLMEGVTRSISGEGARSARQRFRLNTPVAAIGVRGTDFVVSATEQTTRALVNEGAIVMAPYSSDCTAAAFGPCDINAIELTDASLQIIELDGDTIGPRIIPATVEREPGVMREEVQLAIETSADDGEQKAVATDVYLENVTSIQVTQQATDVAIAALDITPDAPLTAQTITNRQLVWGRWSTGIGGQEFITVPRTEARVGRRVTVGNSDYALYRTEGLNNRVDTGLGPVSFALSSAQAYYSSESGIVAMQVNGGVLDIDFDRSQFATELNLDSIATGAVDLVANGSITERGYFTSITDSQRVAGAVSLDGNEAGYFFEQQLEAGNIQGLTLWDRN